MTQKIENSQKSGKDEILQKQQTQDKQEIAEKQIKPKKKAKKGGADEQCDNIQVKPKEKKKLSKKNNKKKDDSQIHSTQASTKSNNKKNENKGKQEKKGKEENFDKVQEKIVEFLKKTNQPFTIKLITDNLKKIISEGKMKKLMEEYVKNNADNEKREILTKQFSPSPLFWYNQNLLEELNKEEMQALQQELKEKRQLTLNSLNQFTLCQKEEISLKQQLTNEQLDQEIDKHEKLLEDVEKQLEYYQSDQYEPVDEQIMNNLIAENKKIRAVYRQRKELIDYFGQELADNMGIKLKQMYETMKIDDDEENI
ncbi:hypothetical protein PPERSA_10181 [Pseudocohnilembus persalinus]|uniref:Homologous-pairing protein 2 winged helix domain-containing protein n=1 Tax=Pseudocohnilembus persalinus TaxID=266149 RepID=A0A0V0QLT8_PSEPJ|nr:hypothetical protein PPERSA_10181 [Pseudocohnilembus persalinus]|eukprot:KRX03100.1 hypothetical protein PPERSA_10181 [Pseudocohnilembus persalinus]